MPGCLSARLKPDDEGLLLPYESNVHQRRRRSRTGQLKLIWFGRCDPACVTYRHPREKNQAPSPRSGAGPSEVAPPEFWADLALQDCHPALMTAHQ